MAELLDDDLLLVQRGGASYKMTGADLKASAGGGIAIDTPPLTLPGLALITKDATVNSDNQLIEFSSDSGTTWADSITVPPSTLINVRWKSTSGDAFAHDATVTSVATVTFTSGTPAPTSQAYSFTVDKLPEDNININPVTDIIPGAVATSSASTVIGGINAVARIWLESSTAATVEVSAAGRPWTAITTSSAAGVGIYESETFQVRYTTSLTPSGTDNAVVRVGYDDTFYVNATFNSTNAATVPPLVGSVALSDSTAGSNRFTSEVFPVQVTMTDEGVPTSTKAMKAYVQGTLVTRPLTDQIVNVGTVTGTPLDQAAAWTPDANSVGANQITPIGNNTYIKLIGVTDVNNGIYRTDVYRLQGSPGSVAEGSWPLITTWGQNSMYIADATPNWIIAVGRRTANDYGYIRVSTDGGTSWSEENYAVNSSTNAQAFSDRGCSPNVFLMCIASTQATSYSVRRYVNGSNAGAPNMEVGASGTNQTSSVRWCRTRRGYWLTTGFDQPMVSRDDGANFSTLSTLGLPPLPAYQSIQCVNGDVWFLDLNNNKAFVTDDFANYSERPIQKVGWGAGFGSWQGWGFTYYQRDVYGSGNYDTWVSLDGTNWRELVNNGHNGNANAWSSMMGGVLNPSIPPVVQWYGNYGNAEGNVSTQTLTFASNKNLTAFVNPDRAVEVNAGGSALDASGIVMSVDTNANTMTLTSPSGTFDVGNYVQGPVKAVDNTTLYCVLDASGNVSDLRGSDPGYVNQAGTPTQVSFPATLPSGNPPDTDLPAGTTLTVAVEATNSTGNSSATSNSVTPV